MHVNHVDRQRLVRKIRGNLLPVIARRESHLPRRLLGLVIPFQIELQFIVGIAVIRRPVSSRPLVQNGKYRRPNPNPIAHRLYVPQGLNKPAPLP